MQAKPNLFNSAFVAQLREFGFFFGGIGYEGI
jgi:hypothetical protein